MQTAWFKWLTTLLTGLCVAGFLGVSSAAAQKPKPTDRKPNPPPVDKGQVDQHLNDFLRDAINRGAELYNNGDTNGCYNLFRSALVAAWYMLDHHPDLRREINTALSRADGQSAVSDRAYTLRSALDATRKGLNIPPTKGTEAKAPVRPNVPAQRTLWERLGGEAKVRKVVDDFVTLAGSDPKVDFTRGGKHNLSPEQMANFKQQMVHFISQATGGPLKYNGLSMKGAHEGMGITNAQFNASVADLRKALEKNNADPADSDALIRLVETTRKDIVQSKGTESTKPADTKPATNPKPEDKKSSGQPAPTPKPPDKKPLKGENTRPPLGKDTTDKKPEDKTAKDDDKQPGDTIDIKGKVMYQGKPLAEATVIFVPKEESNRKRYTLTTMNGSYVIKDIQPGEYTIMFLAPKTVTIPEKYTHPETSGMNAKVTRKDKIFDFRLQ